MNIQNLISELRRRNIFRVATAYAIAGWLIIQISATTFPFLNVPDWVTTVIIVFVAVGFPLVLFFAWAFEITPEGIKTTKEVDESESITHNTGKKINKLIITSLSLLVVFLLTERIFFAESTIVDRDQVSVNNASIAVLPFADMSPQGDQEYFSDGLSEELLNGLAKLNELQVAGRTSSFQYKGTNPDLRDVGEKLGVQHILEGSVRKSGNRIRITAQLIRADNGFHLWSETYDRELTANDVFDIQEEITRKVVQELKIRLLPSEELAINERPTQDIEAYNAFLEATQLEVSNEVDDLKKAIEKYKTAIRLDPTFSLAYARLALVYGDLNWVGNLSLEEMKKLMRDNIDQALLNDGNQGKAYEALGYYYLNIEDNQKALETYERAIELLPGDAEVLYGYHDVLHEFSMHGESHDILLKAYEIDPLNPEIATHLADHYISIEQTEEGLELYDKVLEDSPDFLEAKRRKAQALRGIGYGELGKAFISMYELYTENPEDARVIVDLHGLSASLGLFQLQEYFITRMGELYPNNQSYYFMYANYYADHGQIPKSLEKVETGRGVFSDQFNKEIDTFIARLAFLQGDEENAIKMYEEINPIVLSDSVVINDVDERGDISNYLYYLKNTGQTETERYKYLTEVYCEDVTSAYDEAEIEAIKKYRKWGVGTCEFYRGNEEAYIDMMREQYFDFKITGGFPDHFRFSGNANSLNGIPEYEQLKAEILTDINRMQYEAVEYLKAEGEWQEEWNKSN